MSESEVSQIRDEDVLRRMWQQTEDFSRKKEIRAHMYRLREERLRNLYSPEPTSDGKGCEFTSSQGHVKSFADQTFQSMKSKEVRDAGSPPKEFTYRGQDLKELSNAGWNVESEDRTTDDGRTHVKSVNANIEGRYDVEGGRGQFAAVDHQRQAVTEHHDDNSSLRRDETRFDTAAHEHVVRQTDDGTRHSTTTSSSNTSSKIQQVSSTKHETVPYITDDDYDLRHASHDTNRNDRVTRVTNRNDYEQTSRRNDCIEAELVSRKVEYPDDNTKVIVETRRLPDGTRVTSTRREFHAPAHSHSTRSESHQTRSESKSYSSHHASDTRDSTSKVTRHTIDNRTDDIVDSQRHVDDNDFKRQLRQYTVRDDDDYSNTQRNVTKSARKVSDYSQTEDSQTHSETRINKKYVDQSTTNKEDHTQTQRRTVDRRNDNRVDETDRRQVTSTRDHDIQHNVVKEIHQINDVQEKIHNITSNRRDTEINVRDTTTTDRTDIEQIRKIPVGEKHPYDKNREIPKDEVPRRSQERPGDDQRPNDRNRNVTKEVEPSTRNISTEKKITEERLHNITRDKKIEEVVDRKSSSDQYQTTYQNDFQTRKVSTDWSPTHQAWASTLRSDTPPTTRPSTRASSPGSKTFKSSTSSLRSSVSPDKTSRKPTSRGGSPNKIDRFSPTRTITSDRYSSTHSTHSVNETRTNKTSSPERKPPTGHSPSGSGYSPDRKPQEHRQRPSASPEKRPQSFGDKPYSSPERKPSYKSSPTGRHPAPTSPADKDSIPRSPAGLRQSPDRKPSSPQRKPTEDYSPRASPSPDRKPVYQKPLNRPSDGPLASSPRSSVSPDKRPENVKPLGPRTTPSPDRKPNRSTSTGYPKSSSPYEPENDSDTSDNTSKRPSDSPERKPGYMRPTAASQPDTRRPSQPTEEINRKSPTRQVPSSSPDRLYKDIDKTTKIKEDHYRFVDEKTKTYSQKDTTNVDRTVSQTPNEYSPSRPSEKNPEPRGEDSPDFCIPKRDVKIPSQKGTTIATENDKLHGKVDKTVETITTTVKKDKQTEDITSKRTPINKDYPLSKDAPSRETSPTKYGTYDKMKLRDVTTTEETTVTESTSTDTKDVKYDSLRRLNKTEPAGLPSSPTKKSPREGTSPTKSPTKDVKYKHTTDFITTEKTTEEINKETTSKDHPRQLITPSSSPTRKPKTTETEPSTGQSSPTTSVSGFVYFGSPRPDKPVVTDLDEHYPDSENLESSKRPESLDVRRSPSPSKIPCRSPSPEKHVPTTKDSLPRKSSLKKPSTDVNLTSPIEKPPTNFRVSPSEDKPGLPEHNIIKKDHPQEPETGEPSTTVKPKPPLQRRETYEDRCKKILGMVDDTKTESITKETTRYTKKTRPTQSSPSVSPCDSPAPKESSQFSEFPSKKKVIDRKVDVTDFITREQEHIINTTITPKNKPRTPSREASPTKLQDTTRKTTLTTKKTTEKGDEQTVITTNTTKYTTSRQSPDKSPKDKYPKRPSESPERKTNHELPKKATTGPRDTSPIKQSRPTETPSSRTSLSPERKYPKEKSPLRQSPGRSHQSIKITTSVTSQHDTTSITGIQETTHVRKTSKSPPRRVLESPTRQLPKSQNLPEKSTKQRTTSPSKSHPRDGSPDKHQPRSKQVKPDGSRPDDIAPNKPAVIPGYMKTTEAVTSKFESSTIEDINETHILKATVKKEPRDLSPTQRSTSPTKPERSKRPNSSPQRKSTNDSPRQSKPNNDHSRTPSPTKQSRPADLSPARKNSKHEPASPTKQPRDLSPTRQEPAKIPGYMKSTITSSSKFDKINNEREVIEEITSTIEDQDDTSPEEQPNVAKIPGYMKSTITSSIKFDKNDDEQEDIHEMITSTTEENFVSSRRDSKSPTQKAPKPTEDSISKPSHLTSTLQKPQVPGYMKTTTSVAYKYDTISTEDSEVNATHNKYTFSSTESPVQDSPKSGVHPRSLSPLTPTEKSPRKAATSPERKQSLTSLGKDNAMPEPKDTPVRSSVSPDRPSYMKPTASVISKFDTITTTSQDTQELVDLKKTSPKRVSTSPSRNSPEREPKDTTKPDEPRQLRTPSPVKKITKITEVNTDFILSEKEQEILNKVQKSLRKLSPERKEKSPSRERSPTKSTTSLQDLDIVAKEAVETKEFINRNLSEIFEEQTKKTSDVPRPGKSKQTIENKAQIKPSRTVSPTKKLPTTPNKLDKSPESPTKSRSISPKKPVSHVERPQSPQIPKTSGIKPREQIPGHLTRKPTPATLATTKIERLTTETKKTNGITKQNVFNKTTTSKTISKSTPSPTRKPSEPETRRLSPQKGLKENVSSKKDVVTRTTSEITMKPKKTASPQRMRSKPEIQVSDMSTKTPRSQKPIIKEPHAKLPNKPKSATALNTSTDEDDIIIDVQQSKSSRENSPDRICPTPINFNDDVGTPRFPDEVSEPDDDFVKRTHNIIHETETVVDDIVEICEDEELFVQKPKRDTIIEGDDSILSVTEKVNKFSNKVRSVTKPKDTTTLFKDTEKRVHSDFINENLKSDECLLTVSEKVTKFGKGPKDTKDNRSPSRKITDEYDKDTIYQDDYTKLSVNDKAHLFVETAENIKVTKVKPAQKVERPDLSNVDESLKSDDCLLSVSDKVSKFVKTAENIITDTQSTENTNKNVQESHKKIIRQFNIDDDEDDDETFDRHEIINPQPENRVRPEVKSSPNAKEPKQSQPKVKEYDSPPSKPTERTPTVKITTLRSSEAVKKAKALFENIAQTKETTHTTKTSTKLTDIGVIKKSPNTDSTTALYPSTENTPCVTDVDSELDAPLTRRRPSSGTPAKPQHSHVDEKPRSSPTRLTAASPEVPRTKSPMRQTVEITTTKTVLSRYPASRRAESPRNRAESPLQRTDSPRQRTESPRQRTESPRQRTESPRLRPESDKSDKVPGYLRPTMTSQIKEEPKIIEETEVSSRRGSGKFGVELRRTSVDRSTVSSERRRSVEHHQPCIEDIYDLDLLEQMLEKVTGYEQRRRIRAQIRVARNQSVDSNVYTKTTKTTTTVSKTRSPERTPAKSPERSPKSAPQKTLSPDRFGKSTPQKTISDRHQPKEATPITNGHSKESTKTPTRQRPRSPEKPAQKSSLAPKSPVRQPSPDKRRPMSPNKATPTSKPKSNRFNEYASAYMKKVGLNESDKVKFTDSKTKKTKQTVKHEREDIVQEFKTTKTFNERTSSRDVIEIVQNGKRSPSPGKKQSPERKAQISDKKAQSPERKAHSPSRKVHSPERHLQSPDRIYQRTPSPDFKRPKAETVKETVIKTVYDIEKKKPSKPVQEEKPSWVTNRNLKKITTESRTYSTKKIESEKPKYRAASPSKVISKPTDVITSSYGPGPLDADGRPLFGIKALRNGATNFQVKGTVIRQEFHSRNGGEPEGTVSVTAYSSQPEELEQLLASQGVESPSRLHGLAAISTTKKFGGDTGNSLSNVHTKEERASLEHFTHTDRKTDSRVENLDTRVYDRVEDVSSRKTDSRSDRLNDKSRTVKKEDKSTEIKRGSVEERRERVEKREDKKTVRQSSVKSLTEKYIKSTNDSSKSDRTSYPKAGLILRTTSMRDSVSSDDAQPGLTRGESDHSLGSGEDTVVTTTERTGDGVRTTTTRTTHHHGPTITHTRTIHEPVVTKNTSTIITQEPLVTNTRTIHEPTVTKKTSTVLAQEPLITKKTTYVTQTQEPKVTRQGTTTTTTERSFLDSSSKVTGVQDILTRMKNADIVIQEGDTAEDAEARALLNKFLGATVLMAGMQGYVAEQPEGRVTVRQETVRTGSGGKVTSSSSIQEFDIDHCWDERLLKKLLDECTDYEQRRRLRARIRTLMAEQEACASAVTEALGAAGAVEGDGGDAREEEEVTVTSSVRRDSSDKTVSSSTTTTKTSKVIEMTRSAPKPVSPFAKFRQLEKQNSTNSPNSPKSPQSPGSPSQPYFKFTDPALQCSALTIKERLLQWCRDKTRDYENVKLENFSTSWADGLAFCALVHHFLPHTFDYSKLTPERRRHNFTLAFKVADEKAGIYPLLDVDDMVAMRKPDWKCVFTYVQAIYRRFKDQD